MTRLGLIRLFTIGILVSAAGGAPVASYLVHRPHPVTLPRVVTVPEVTIYGEVPIPVVDVRDLPLEPRKRSRRFWWPRRVTGTPVTNSPTTPCKRRSLNQGTGSVRMCGDFR